MVKCDMILHVESNLKVGNLSFEKVENFKSLGVNINNSVTTCIEK